MKRLVIVDRNVDGLWGAQVRQYFAAHGVDARIVVLPTWEENKTFDLVFRVAEEIENAKLNRRKEPLIAIGGGVCLDICGLAANLYRRNTPVIKVRCCDGLNGTTGARTLLYFVTNVWSMLLSLSLSAPAECTS